MSVIWNKKEKYWYCNICNSRYNKKCKKCKGSGKEVYDKESYLWRICDCCNCIRKINYFKENR